MHRLLEMETDGLLEWHSKEYSYIRTATPTTLSVLATTAAEELLADLRA
ncbi:hypothetical protein [Amycolatopsis sp. NPDC004079]